MSPVRTATYAFLILLLLGLAGWGILQVSTREEAQVIGAQTEPTEPQALTREEVIAILDKAIASGRSAVEEFVASGADPCSVESAGSTGIRSTTYESLAALVNDVDLIVEGDLGVSSVLEPPPNVDAARIRTEFNVREVLLGSTSAETITIGAGESVTRSGDRLVRRGRPHFDQCSGDHVLLFLNEFAGIFGVAAQGFVTFGDDTVDTARSSDLFASSISADTLRADIRRMVSDQEARDLPKGRLVCDAKRDSDTSKDPMACPGDSFNPFQAFGLARLLEVDIQKLGEHEVLAARGDLPTDTPSLLSMLALLDRTVSIEPADDPVGNVILLTVTTTTTGTPPSSVRFEYEAGTDSIWLNASGGRFPAPEGFGAALEALLLRP